MLLIVTRPPAQAAAWVRELRALGHAAQALPLIEIAPAAEPQPVHAAWQHLPERALVMFVSANAVQQFFAMAPAPQCLQRLLPVSSTDPSGQRGAAWPAGVRAASTGPGTSAALRAAGVPSSAIVGPAADAARFDSEALWAQLADEDWAGRRVLVVRGEEGRDWLAETLRARGATVDFVAAYRRLAPQPDAAGQALLRDALALPAEHLWLFSSSEAVTQLQALAPQADWSRSRAVASHPRIAEAAKGAGFGQVELVPASPTEVAARAAAWPPIQSGSP